MSDSVSLDEYFRCKQMYRMAQQQVDKLREENNKLHELLYNLKKDGYRYDAISQTMQLCDKCYEELSDDIKNN